MPIYLPETTVTSADTLTPRQIVAELDKYVVGQTRAKRAVAIALREPDAPAEASPGPRGGGCAQEHPHDRSTGVGKTEIARRLARLAQSPFIKVEASKFTEVGYVGRDVESMVRDLVELAVDMVREEQLVEVREKARDNAEERLLDLLLPPLQQPSPIGRAGGDKPDLEGAHEHVQRTREKVSRTAAGGSARYACGRGRGPRQIVSVLRSGSRARRSRRSIST